MFSMWSRWTTRRRALSSLLQQAGLARSLIVEDIPSMINPSEQQFLYLLARHYFQGNGVIADAGIFLGSSTRSFTAGLRDRPDLERLLRAGRPVRSYDLGLCDDHMAAMTNAHYGTRFESGDSFLEILRNNIQGTEDCVQFFAGDIMNQTIDAPIEVLFLDVCKTSSVNAHVIKHFFPRLIAGHSVLIHQDFIHEYLPWIHITMGLFEPFFQFIGVIGESPSAVWLNTRTIPSPTPWEQEGGFDLYQSGPLPRLIELFERGIKSLTTENQRYLVDLAKSRMIAERGDKPGSLEFLERLNLRFDRLRNRPHYYPRPAVMKDFIEAWVR